MYSYSRLRAEVQRLRSEGKTFGEIQDSLGIRVSKSTLSYWCSSVTLPEAYSLKVSDLVRKNIVKAQRQAVIVNMKKRQAFFEQLRYRNLPIANTILQKNTAKIALAMLCLGEASKYSKISRRSFCLGNSDPRIITLFLELLKICFEFDPKKVRCTVQCRADQDISALEEYWMKITHIPKKFFYKALVDPRTKGKPTQKSAYKGVLRVDYFDLKIQHELETLADLVYNTLIHGPVA